MKKSVDQDAISNNDSVSSAEVPFVVLAPGHSWLRLVRAGLAALLVMIAMATGFFALFAENAELRAAERKPLTSPAHESFGRHDAAKTTRVARGKNVDTEPAGIALSGDSLEAAPLEDALDRRAGKKKETPAKAKPKKETKKTAAVKAKKKMPSKKPATAKTATPKKTVVVTSSPEPARLVEKAEAKLDAGRYEEAIALYDQALLKDGNDDAAWRGKAYALQQSDSPGAVNELHKMVAQKPFSGPAYAALAQAFLNQGDNSAATLALEKAVSLEPSNNDYLLRLAILHDRFGHDARALELYRKLKIPLPYAVKKRIEYLVLQEAQPD
jgi:tetratricopeptide (TPR) repeat protein